jgi:hypothetical protein
MNLKEQLTEIQEDQNEDEQLIRQETEREPQLILAEEDAKHNE